MLSHRLRVDVSTLHCNEPLLDEKEARNLSVGMLSHRLNVMLCCSEPLPEEELEKEADREISSEEQTVGTEDILALSDTS